MASSLFSLESDFKPGGDQQRAIDDLVRGYRQGSKYQTLLGVTGSGKTFTMANVIEQLALPTLIITHNKTLVAQLYQEFKSFFPRNSVEYFVSFYDYYQPEAYIPSSDTYIEKDSSINDEIEKLRLKTTASLMTRQDAIVVSSVSCIYGLGSPEDYSALMVTVRVGEERERDNILRSLVDIHYTRNDFDFNRGTFRVRGDIVEIRPAYDDFAIRIEFFGDLIDKILRVNYITGEVEADLDETLIYPAKHYVTREENIDRILSDINRELEERLMVLREQNKLVEAQRLESRTRYDIEMIKETGFCSGIENYSRIIENRLPGTHPHTLMDFFPSDYLLIIDESHVSIPQIGGMYAGDRSRKQNLVDFGFRLPCAMDNRPLNFEEFENRLPRTLFASATPADYEIQKSEGVVVEQIVRPTGLLDPLISVRPIKGQIDDLLQEIHKRISKNERTLVLTLTQKSAEDLSDFLEEAGLKVLYMHAKTETLKRTEILNKLRRGDIDVLVGINLLREGLDLPEVSLVTILDADKEGFLRNERTLIQMIGRAARNVNGQVIMYADVLTRSIKKAMEITQNRRTHQKVYNRKHGITPRTIIKAIRDTIQIIDQNESSNIRSVGNFKDHDELVSVEELERCMLDAAENLDFEKAALLRDKIKSIKALK